MNFTGMAGENQYYTWPCVNTQALFLLIILNEFFACPQVIFYYPCADYYSAEPLPRTFYRPLEFSLCAVYSSLSYESSFLGLSGLLALYPRLRKSLKLCLCFPSCATSCRLTIGSCGAHRVCLLYSGITLLHCLIPSVMITALHILSGFLVTSDDRVNPILVNCILIGKSAELLKMYVVRSQTWDSGSPVGLR